MAKKDEPKKVTIKLAGEPPKVVKPLTPVVCKLGDAVRMETVITGSPAPTLTWQHNGRGLPSHARVVEEGDGLRALVIDAAALEDEGDFLVRAENEGGSAQTSANLCVQGEREMNKHLVSVEVKAILFLESKMNFRRNIQLCSAATFCVD